MGRNNIQLTKYFNALGIILQNFIREESAPPWRIAVRLSYLNIINISYLTDIQSINFPLLEN